MQNIQLSSQANLHVTPLLEELYMDDFRIVELTSREEVMNEGWRLQNGVEDFTFSEEGQTRFFSFCPIDGASKDSFTAVYRLHDRFGVCLLSAVGLAGREVTTSETTVLDKHLIRADVQAHYGVLATLIENVFSEFGLRLLRKRLLSVREKKEVMHKLRRRIRADMDAGL